MTDDHLPLMRHEIIVRDGQKGMNEFRSAGMLVIEPGRGADEGDYLINATEWERVDKEENGEIVGVEVPDNPDLTQHWFTGADTDKTPEIGRYYFNRNSGTGMPNMFKIRDTEYSGPVGPGGDILQEYVGREQDMIHLDAVPASWFDTYEHDLFPLEKIKSMTVEIGDE